MGQTIQFRRGAFANLPALQEAEPGWCTDTEALYIGGAEGSVAGAVRVGGYEVDALRYLPNTFTQATIEAALTAIGTSSVCTLLLRPGTWVISSNADWSLYTNVTFKIVPGAVISHAAFTVKIPNLEAGLYQVFSGAGAVTLSGVKESYPQWWGAVGDGVTDDTAAFEAAQASMTYGTIQLLGATYLVSRAINLASGWNIKGDSRLSSIIKRTDTTAETLDGVATTTVIYISGTWVGIEDVTIKGVVASIDGITFSNAGANSHVNLNRVDIQYCKTAITESQGFFMSTFNDVNIGSCENGFSFISALGKTSLMFNSCYASSCGQAWDFVNTVYSTLNSCGTDYANGGAILTAITGGVYGDPTTVKGIYNFSVSSVVMNGCGAEGGYGNGVVAAAGSQITINNLTSSSCRSTYHPDYGTYPNYGVGPIQTGTGQSTIIITSPTITDWHNTVVDADHPTKPIASLVAFNYDADVSGATNQRMVTVFGGGSGGFAGMGAYWKNCVAFDDMASLTHGAYKRITVPVVVTGTGTKLLIPITVQGSLNMKHYIKITGLDGVYNAGVPLSFQGECSFVSLDAGPINFTTWNLSNITTIAADAGATGVEVTISAARTDPLIMLEILSELPSLIDIDSITIS
jgi:hypothetical protein